jgi:hypothetical protein
METGVTQSASLVAQLNFSRTATAQRSTTASPAAGNANTATSVTATDSFELSIKIDATFVGRVLQDDLESRLDEMLAGAGIEGAAADLMEGGTDFSPEATAGRIVEFSVGFYGQYEAQFAGEGEALESFVGLIGGAVDQGFADARAMLEGFEEMTSDLWDNVQRTQELTMDGIGAFAEAIRSQGAEAPTENATTEQVADPTGPI